MPFTPYPQLPALLAAEQAAYRERNPLSAALAQRSSAHWLFGVPLHWMQDWGTPFALHVAQAQGAQVVDADGHTLVDFCLGDTGAMFGHAPAAVVQAIAAQAARGSTAMMSCADAAWVGAELARRFGLPQWQMALSASDANRFLLRWVRAATGRSKVLVFNGCYHGTVDDVLVDLVQGQPQLRDSLLGQVYDVREHTVVVEFNDLDALRAALQENAVACVLAEPVMTNVGMVLPEPGYWQAAQALVREHGALLVLDETHTISSGPGGYAQAHGLQPDALVLGKPIAGGLPCAVYGMSAELAERAMQAKRAAPPGHSGIGTTLSGNLLAMAAMRATLEYVATPAAYEHMLALAGELAKGLEAVLHQHGLPWCVTQVGARCEFQFGLQSPRDGSEAQALFAPELEHYIHLALLNRGVLITPFHNMLLVSPATTQQHVQQLLQALDEVLAPLRV
ncbi:aspartate aminotransferase family protein [Curvibacter sp. CHRR-16]|uniref:aspartate aminotransferase family protein n=1 Tax=Curvibacter sp. CHRR-16 TaxID=2835872 RepID=UPI001BDA2AFB|nr:aspartate aminotransferase family protein [Curvibacter sp. CHRR-16]MBT0569105.1 aspartate aminotransferase family protein [Curvibacter sp. CHRR-16]